MSFVALSRLLVACLFVALAACSTGSVVRPGEGVTVVRQEGLPTPLASDMSPAPRGYVIGPLDKLDIIVFGIEELSREEVQVDNAGDLGVPLVGTVRAAGLTPAELATSISDGLRAKSVRNPQVTVSVKQLVSHLIAVEGEVREPGIFPVEGSMTLMRAIARAQGLTEFARTNEVLVFRTVGDQRLVGVYDLRALRAGTYADPLVYANDLVVVGDSPRRRTFRTLVEGAALLSPLVILLQ